MTYCTANELLSTNNTAGYTKHRWLTILTNNMAGHMVDRWLTILTKIMSGYLIHRWLTILTKIMAGDSIDGSQYNRLFNRWLTIPTNTTADIYLIDRWLTILTNRLACALTIICQNYKEKSGVPATVHLPSSPRLL